MTKLLMAGLLVGVLGLWNSARVPVSVAQQPSPTPVRVIIATSTPVSTWQQLATATFTWTPTPPAPTQLEALPDAGEVNVRSEPDPSAQRLGVIRAGERFVVRGRYFSWLNFDFPQSPTGTGWVFGQLVTIIGDEAAIPEINPFAAPTSAADAAQAATLEAVLALPGGDATATAASRILVLPTSTVDVGAMPVLPGSRPTFTPPAEFNLRTAAAAEPTQGDSIAAAISTVGTQGLPPAVPIAVLATAGVLGLFVGMLRR